MTQTPPFVKWIGSGRAQVQHPGGAVSSGPVIRDGNLVCMDTGSPDLTTRTVVPRDEVPRQAPIAQDLSKGSRPSDQGWEQSWCAQVNGLRWSPQQLGAGRPTRRGCPAEDRRQMNEATVGHRLSGREKGADQVDRGEVMQAGGSAVFDAGDVQSDPEPQPVPKTCTTQTRGWAQAPRTTDQP